MNNEIASEINIKFFCKKRDFKTSFFNFMIRK